MTVQDPGRTIAPGTVAVAAPDLVPLARERDGLDSCVHCGFCLPACPTYLALEDENDSPRGRLVLMHALLDGRVRPDDPAVGRHLDQCLGCRGCETACPSGVPYGTLIEATRAALAPHRPLPFVARLVLAIFAREWLLRPALAVARAARGTGVARLMSRWLPRRLAMPFAMLDSTARPAAADWTAAGDGTRGTAAVLTGCVMEGLFTGVNRATERALVVSGFTLRAAPGQRCCGALHAHAGDRTAAQALARANITAFERSGAEVVVLNSAGCGAMCKEYAHLLGDDPAWAARAAAFSAKVRDVSEVLAGPGLRAGPRTATAPGEDRAPVARVSTAASEEPAAPEGEAVRVAYDAPCHLQHAQRVVEPPLALLRACAHVTLVPLADSDQCCGSAGIYSLVQPEVSERVLAPKLARIAESGAQVVATGNPGCLMQIGGGLRLAGRQAVARHPVELLDEDYARAHRPG